MAVGDRGAIVQSGSLASAQLAVRGRAGGAGVELAITGEIGRPYRLQAASDLAHPAWADLFTFTNTQDSTTIFLDSEAAQHPQRFYRVRSP